MHLLIHFQPSTFTTSLLHYLMPFRPHHLSYTNLVEQPRTLTISTTNRPQALVPAFSRKLVFSSSTLAVEIH